MSLKDKKMVFGFLSCCYTDGDVWDAVRELKEKIYEDDKITEIDRCFKLIDEVFGE